MQQQRIQTIMDMYVNSSNSYFYMFLISCTLIQAVHSYPPRRKCLEYDNMNGNDLENNATRRKNCARSQNMCFAVWKWEVKNGEEFTAVLKQGCWQYENNEHESCGNTKCVSLGLYDRPGNTEFCCCQADLCNRNFKLAKKYVTTTEKSFSTRSQGVQDTSLGHVKYAGIILAACMLVAVTSAILSTFLWWRRRTQRGALHINDEMPSSTILQHTRLISPIEKGKFGEIWLGTLQSKLVAIKTFPSFQKSSWEHEKNIYNLGLEHSGILKYFGASTFPAQNNVSFVLVVEYHPRGSLRYCLRSTTFSWNEMCTMILSVAEALAYLHGELGSNKLPCIVHRDISSENILVKENGSCVICDFGLSRAMSVEEKGHIISQENQKVGSLRYMAPEALEGHINLNDLISQLKQIDIYALGIVLWEISSRCRDICEGYVVPKYRLPFEQLGSDLTIDTLKNYVLVRKMRPIFPHVWNEKHHRVTSIRELICDCWDQDAEARLSASCVCQRVLQLEHHKNKS